MRYPGGMVSFVPAARDGRTGEERARRFVEGTRIFVLAESLGLDRADAARAARLYALLDPMESMSYALGRLEILRIKGRQKERLGARFSEKQFHDRVLSYGAIPLPLIEAALERDWR